MYKRELSGKTMGGRGNISAECSEPEVFCVLNRRFAYYPDSMRMLEVGYYDEAPNEETCVVPQFDLSPVSPRMLVIVPTLRCNLDCRYCFAKGDDDQEQKMDMDFEQLKKMLDMIPAGRQATVCFFGGEPVIAWDRILEGVEYAKARFIKPSFSLTSNGTLLDERKIAWLAKNNFALIISLDGTKWLHDSSRPDKSGGGTYNKVIATLELISHYPALASATTLRATFDGADKHAHLVTRLIHLNEITDRFGLGNVSVEPADLSEGCGGAGVPVEAGEALYEEYLDAAEWYVGELKAGRKPKFHHFAIRIQRIKNRKPSPSECGAGVGYVAAAPDGSLHACHRLGCRIGKVGCGIDRRLQQPWRDNRYYARHSCPDCWLRNLCGCGCRINSINNCGDIRQLDTLGCWLKEVCVKCAAWILAETTKEIADKTDVSFMPEGTPEILPDQAG